jgi:hypothetical protein
VIRQLRAAQTDLAALTALAMLLFPALLVAAPRARAEGTVDYTKEDLSQYEDQLNGNQIESVVVNKRTRSLRVTLTNGQHVFAKYGKKQGPKYYAAIRARHVPITFLSPAAVKAEQGSKHPGHKIRYIAGGVLIAVIMIAGGILYFNRGREAVLD